jgi:Zincin-like metallopeptidase
VPCCENAAVQEASIRYTDFESLIQRLATEVPSEFLDGVGGVEVSRKTLPHPTRRGVYTLGECIPLPAEALGDPAGMRSRVVLYHGSFQALACLDEQFDWRGEAWETLTHELRHHLEWRARAPELEAFDWAAEQNFARTDGDPFDTLFHRSGSRVAKGCFRIDDDFFLEVNLSRIPPELHFEWHGQGYRTRLPPGLTLPAFGAVEGVEDPPPGELVLVLRQKFAFANLFARRLPWRGSLRAERADALVQRPVPSDDRPR